MVNKNSSESNNVGDINFRSLVVKEPGLLKLLQKTIWSLLTEGKQVYIEGLGILYCSEQARTSNRFRGSQTVYRQERFRVVKFEKTYEVTTFHRDKYHELYELKHLAQVLYSKLPVGLLNTSKELLLKQLKQFFEEMRAELLTSGISEQIRALGCFHALRLNADSTSSWQDKFAAADIIFIPRKDELISVSNEYVFDTPILKSAWEPLESLYGEAIETKNLNLLSELTELGYSTENLASEFEMESLSLPVAVFQDESSYADRDVYLYCTNQVRKLACKYDFEQTGTEFVFQLVVPKGATPPEWPYKVIVTAWILLNTTQDKTLKNSIALEIKEENVFPEAHNLSGIITNNFAKISSLMTTLEGHFRFVNILGIGKRDLAFIRQTSAEKLLDILRHKDVDQVTRKNRFQIV